MVSDLCIPVEIVGVATERNNEGLALSSRNGYLSEQELEKAPLIYKTLKDVVFALQQGNDFDSTIEQAQERLQKGGFIVDYLTLCRESDLKCATSEDARLVLLVAAYLGTARLIDNLAFPLNRAND